MSSIQDSVQHSVQIITIDGPAASGKTSVSRGLAQKLGWSWISTGAFYRGLAYICHRERVELKNEEAIVFVVKNSDWSIKMSDEKTMVFYKGEDVTSHIYSEDVGIVASQISHYPKVRESLLTAQRNCALGVKGLVAEGRDCGTVVFPSARIKIYLTAKSESRAERRALEEGKSVQETQAVQVLRDAQDSQRTAAPLQIPPNAHVVDTSEMNLDQVVEHIYRYVQSQENGLHA